MWEYCGCQQNDVIAELTAEHDRLRDLSRNLTAAVNTTDLEAAGRLATQMQAVLGPHTQVEETALFPALAADFADQLAQLIAEHRTIDVAFDELVSERPQPGWRLRTQLALAHLFDHIRKEQDGVFPAALANLSAADWDAVAHARDHAHQPPQCGADRTATGVTTNAPQPRSVGNAHDLAALAHEHDARGAVWRLSDDDRQLDTNIVRVAPHDAIGPHNGPELDVLILVLAGTGELDTGAAETVTLPAGEVM